MNEEYQKTLRKLQKNENIDGNEYLALQEKVAAFGPLRQEHDSLKQDLRRLQRNRRELLVKWRDLLSTDFRTLQQAAKSVSKKLKDQVRVTVRFQGQREALYELFKTQPGQSKQIIAYLDSIDDLSLSELADACRNGKESLKQFVSGIPNGQLDTFSSRPEDFYMQIEELDLPAQTTIELNIASPEDGPNWKTLDRLSTGQKATAVLLLLLLESDGPLIVDQPEDDLDNRFITKVIVPKMREEKRRRQFVFSTHNANIPVLGDAELVLGLTAAGNEDSSSYAMIQDGHIGAIDTPSVRAIMESILEGGKEAFRIRREKYKF